MGYKEVNIVRYPDDAVFIAEAEDAMQRLLHESNRTGKTFNMRIFATKTKCMTVSKTPLRCKLELNGHVLELEMKFWELNCQALGILNKK